MFHPQNLHEKQGVMVRTQQWMQVLAGEWMSEVLYPASLAELESPIQCARSTLQNSEG